MATERKASRAVPALPVKGCTSPYSTIISISTSSTGSCVMNKMRVYTNSSSTIFAVLADMHNNEVEHQYSNTNVGHSNSSYRIDTVVLVTVMVMLVVVTVVLVTV